MVIVLFISYTILFSFLITRISFFQKAELSNNILIGLFVIKIAAGLGYAFFYQLPAYNANSDTYRFFNYSLQETDVLLHHPIQFIKELFSFGYSTSGNLFVGDNSYWNDLKSNIIIKLLAVCNIFSFRSYYVNIIFFNFFFFTGTIALYRFIKAYYAEQKWLTIACTFLIPSFLFWCSGIHKDGLIFSLIAIVLWQFNQCLKNKFNFKKLLIITIALLLLFGLRNYVCLSITLCLISWFWAEKKQSIKPFFYIYSIAFVFFFCGSLINNQLNFPQYLVTKQEEFKKLSGGSSIATTVLEPNLMSFIKYLPQATDIVLLRPHFTEIKNKSYLPAIVENTLVLILLIGVVVLKKKNHKLPFALLATLFFAITLLLITGYTITFSGAIVRYKSIALPLLILPLLSYLDVQKIKKR